MSDHPNILFIVFDDLADRPFGIGGHPLAKTPNLDRLAARGVRFSNAHCNAPICSPSRASFLTGLMPHTTGYYAHSKQLGRGPGRGWAEHPVLRESATFMEHFRRHGYTTYGTGKVFHNGHERPSVWDHEGPKSSWAPYPWDGDPAKKHDWNEVELPGKPGMGSDVLFGRLSELPFGEAATPERTGWIKAGENFRYAGPDDRDLLTDEESADWLIERLGESHAAPFLMCFGVCRPHTPLVVPDEYFDLYPLEEIELPPSVLAGDDADCSACLIGEGADINTGKWNRQKFEILIDYAGERGVREFIQGYLAAVSFADAQVGRVLDALDENGLTDQTLVVVTADHGYHLGEKDLVFKNTLWDASTRVPQIWAGPGVTAGATCERAVANIDLFPTLCAMTGITAEGVHDAGHGMPLDGTSLRELLIDPTSESGPDYALTAVANADKHRPADTIDPDQQQWALRTQRYRFIRCRDGSRELYDHADDPHEWHNRIDDPTYTTVAAELEIMMNTAIAQKQP